MISVKNLKKTYFLGGEEVHALDDVSLSIKEHEFVAIIGQSGSGKSTFMNAMLDKIPFDNPRKQQIEALEFLKNSKAKFSILEMPT